MLERWAPSLIKLGESYAVIAQVTKKKSTKLVGMKFVTIVRLVLRKSSLLKAYGLQENVPTVNPFMPTVQTFAV